MKLGNMLRKQFECDSFIDVRNPSQKLMVHGYYLVHIIIRKHNVGTFFRYLETQHKFLKIIPNELNHTLRFVYTTHIA